MGLLKKVFRLRHPLDERQVVQLESYLRLVDTELMPQPFADWNRPHLTLGVYHLWVDEQGRLRIKNGPPQSDTDGTVVGTQV